MESGITFTVNGDIVYTIKDGKIEFREDIEVGKSKTESLVDAVEKINQIDGITAAVDPIGLIEVRAGLTKVAFVDIDVKYGLTIRAEFSSRIPEETRGELLTLLIDISSRMPAKYEEQYEVYIESIDEVTDLYLYKSDLTGNLFFASTSSTKFTEDELSMLPKYILEGIKSELFKKRQVI